MWSPKSDPLDIQDMRIVLAMYREKTTLRAAASLGLTQSAVSHALKRLRSRIGDPLFVRAGNHMVATPLAELLQEAARQALGTIADAFAGFEAFDPLRSTRAFRIGVNEVGAITLIPRVAAALEQAAPGTTLIPVGVHGDTLTDLLEQGQLDLAAGSFASPGDRLISRFLYEREYTGIVRRQSDAHAIPLTLPAFAALPHVRVTMAPSTQAWIDRLLRKHGTAHAAVELTTQHMAAAPFIVAQTRSAAIIPTEVYHLFKRIADIQRVELPIRIPPVAIHMYWHQKMSGDAGVAFLSALLHRVAANDDPLARH